MDWKHILSLSFDELTDLKRDEIYEQLVGLRRESLDKKHYKKLIDMLQHILRYKGDMVNTLLTELEVISSKDLPHINTEVLLSENVQLKAIIAKLDADKAKLKARISELTEENAFLQRRTAQQHHQHDGSTPGAATNSDREDSPDALSELDKHEALLANISQKNKHIKRLLRDIDGLESKVSTQFDQIAQLRDSLQDATGNMDVMGGQLDEHKRLLAEQTTTIEALRLNVRNMEDQNAAMEREREEREREISEFGARLEERAVRWRDMLQEKDDRLDSLRTKYEHVLERDPACNIDAERLEVQRMSDAINVRDEVIADLEAKVSELSREMIDTTDIMNRLAKERETCASGGESARLKCTSCEDSRGRLEKALARCSELQDLIGAAEEDSALKSNQAMDAIEALSAFKSGQDGLVHALRKNAELQAQVQTRDKHVRSLIAELNVMQELAQENTVLRKRLGIPDDELVCTNSYVAKQKKFEKLNERLALKLRASEEMRLQLKLDKNDLKRQLAHVIDGNGISPTEPEAIRHCEQCLKRYNTSHVKCDACHAQKDLNLCQKCSKSSPEESVKIPVKTNAPALIVDAELNKLAENYAIVVEENENLRIGMHEILQQLRNYDAESDHIVIDTPTLEKLLHALDARSVSGWYHPAMRMQNELIAVKEREIALKERVRLKEVCPKEPVAVTLQSTTLPTNEQENGQITSKKDSCSQSSTVTTFDNLVQRLIDQETELAASQTALEAALQNQRDTELACDHLKQIEGQYHDLTEMLANAEDEQVAAISRQSEELVALRSRLNAAERKRQYAEEDFGLWRFQHRAMLERQTCLLFEVRKELIAVKNRYVKQEVVENIDHSQEKSDNLMRELSYLKLKLSKFTANALHDFAKLDADQQLPIDFEKINRMGMIQNGCAVHFITKSEIDNLKNENKCLTDRTKKLTETNRHLEDLLQMSQDQLQSQQKLLNDQSEDEISLRHLIVDLQSDSQEKYIIAKIGRELQQARNNELELKAENERLTTETARLQDRLNEEVERVRRIEEGRQDKEADCELKLKFLSKSHADLRDNFQQFTPLYPLVEFIQHYSMVLDAKKHFEKSLKQSQIDANEEQLQQVCDAVRHSIEKGGNVMEDKIDIIKQQTQNAYLKQQLDLANNQIEDLHNELKTMKLRAADWSQQWDTIQMLFGPTQSITTREFEQPKATVVDTAAVQVQHKETQSLVKTSDRSVNTETEFIKPDSDHSDTSDSSEHATFTVEATISSESLAGPPQPAPRHTKPSAGPSSFVEPPLPPNTSDISLASQLKQAMALASARSALLLDAEHQLTTAQARIKALERSLQERDKSLREMRENASKSSSPRRDDNILSVTIASLQGLLQEKDTTMARYQDLLRGERENRTAAYEEHRAEVREIQQQIDELTGLVRTKDRELEALKSQKTTDKTDRRETSKTPALSANQRRVSFDSSAGQPMPDALIEDLFLEEYRTDNDSETSTDTRRRVQELEEETRSLHAKLREVSKRESGWERTLCEKDKQIAALNDRIGQDKMNFEEISSSITARRDIDQLRELLDEKDRHIGDLTETLTHFHDDQQKFMNDTSIHSAEQVSQLSADLSRSDATNRILTTQLDAMKRQLTAIAQRESQAREVIKTLKTQLIRRPVISVKTASADRPPSTREEQLQKRMHLQDQELQQTKEELRQLSTAAQCRRNKDAAELALWNKQKRSQQLADTLRQKLVERDAELDKVKGHLASAKTAIARLEREKHILETRQKSGQKLCQSPSCPNIHVSTKYTAAESPDSYDMSRMINYAEQQPPLSAESQPGSSRSRQTGVMLDISDGNQEVIDALRARIEAQQRRIVAMELEGRGGTAMGGELERMQEKVSNVEAMNIRLEARNLHLQLENDMLRQGDQGEKTRRQIKHLEDYIIALKSELTQIQINAADAHKQHSVVHSSGTLSQQQHMEQTILSMRRVVERLKFENKQLKDGKPAASSTTSTSTGSKGQATVVKEIYEKMRTDLEQVQQSYSESLDKISALQIELDIQRRTCSACKNMMEKSTSDGESSAVGSLDDVSSLKDKLIKKTQLLEKAKILLSRAATKEKHFREQMIFWKRRCAELQNVPVIEETSE